MFGEYAIYCNEKVVALVCDDQLFVKPTVIGKELSGEVTLAPPYQGAKDYFLISEDFWENQRWLSKLIRLTAEELPTSKSKK